MWNNISSLSKFSLSLYQRQLYDMLYIPEFTFNIISVQKLIASLNSSRWTIPRCTSALVWQPSQRPFVFAYMQPSSPVFDDLDAGATIWRNMCPHVHASYAFNAYSFHWWTLPVITAGLRWLLSSHHLFDTAAWLEPPFLTSRFTTFVTSLDHITYMLQLEREY